MPKEKDFEFIPIFSKNTQKKDMTRNSKDSCPINTLKHLFNPLMAVPKSNVSLRSLKAKPNNPATQEILLSSLSNTDKCQRTASGSLNDQRSNELSSHTDKNQLSIGEMSSSGNVFVAPTSRAPQARKNNCNASLDEIIKAATFAYCILDPETSKQLFTVMTAYTLNCIEECSPGTSDSQKNSNSSFFNEIEDWLKKIVSGNSFACSAAPGLDMGDMDNMSSVSGFFPPHQQAPFQNPNEPLHERYPFMHRADSAYSSMPQFTNNDHRNQVLSMPSVSSNTSVLLPSFMTNRAESVVGSVYQQPNSGHINQTVPSRPPVPSNVSVLLPSFMTNRAESVIGSAYQQPNSSHINQMAMYYPNASVMGFQPAPSMRSDASFMLYRPMDSIYNNGPVMMNHNNYPQMQQMGNTNQNAMRSSTESNMRRAPSVVSGLQYETEGDERRSTFDFNNKSTRKVLAPLQPLVILERCDESRDASSANQMTRTSSFLKRAPALSSQSKNASSAQNQSHYISSRLMSTLNGQKSSQQLPSATPARGLENQINQSRIIRITRSGRAVRAPHNFQCFEGTMNQSGVVKITRSGRVVRAPQNFWSSDVPTSSNRQNSQVRGIKRGRHF